MVLGKPAGISEGGEQPCRKKGEDLLFPRWKIAKYRITDILCWKNGVMIADLAAVQNSLYVQRERFCVSPLFLAMSSLSFWNCFFVSAET